MSSTDGLPLPLAKAVIYLMAFLERDLTARRFRTWWVFEREEPRPTGRAHDEVPTGQLLVRVRLGVRGGTQTPQPGCPAFKQ